MNESTNTSSRLPRKQTEPCCSESTFSTRVKTGHLPAALTDTARYDLETEGPALELTDFEYRSLVSRPQPLANDLSVKYRWPSNLAQTEKLV